MSSRMVADKMVAQVAREMATSVWEEALSKDNDLYRGIRRANPHRSLEQCRVAFVRVLAPRLVGEARATLAAMLATGIDESLKLRIYDSLIRDASLRGVRSMKGQLGLTQH